MPDPNAEFQQAAREDQGQGFGNSPKKPRNPLHKPNQELIELAQRHPVPEDLFQHEDNEQ